MSQSGRKTSIGTALIKRKKKEKSKKSESVPSVVAHHNQTIKNNAPKDIKEKENEEENYDVIVIPASHSTSLKWCLFNVESEQDTQGYPGTPTDFILKHFLAEFKNLTNAKIQEILQSNLEEPLSLTEVFRPNKQNAIISNFHQVVTSLAVVAQHKCLSFIINAIKEWRNYQFSISAKDKQTKNLTKDQHATLEEKHSLIVEYIFVTTVLSLLETWTSTNSLSDKESDALELIALDYFKSRTERTSAIPEKENNRKKVTYHFSLLVRVLAKHNFSRVINRFYESIFSLISSSKSKPHAIAKLEGMHYIQLTIQTQREVDDTLNFLTIFCEALKSKTGKANKDTRLSLSLMLVSTLRSLVTQQRAPGLDYLEFNRLLTGLFDYYSSSVERKRSISNFRIQTVYPFLTALLAAVDEEFFLVNWIELIDSVKKFLKERNHRIIAINTICLLVEAYCTKFSQKDQQYRERMDFITEILFYKKHRAGEVYFAQGESTATLEIIANIIVIIAQRDLDYAIRKIIFELIRSEIKKLPLEGQPEKVFIAFRAIGRIFEISQSSTTPNPSSSSDQLTTLNNNNNNSSLSSQFLNSLEEFMPSICDFTKQLILALDTVFREWLLSNQTKTINELFQKERVPALALYILRLCVSFIPPAIPSGMSDSDLVNILARYLVHIDSDLRDKAYNRLYVLMKTSPRHRPIIITGVGKFILTLPDRKVDIIIMVLNKLKEFVNFWVDLPPSLNIVSEKEKISEKEYEIHKDLSVSVNFLTEFEAIALVYLCNPNSTIRSIGLQLLFSIRLLAAHSSNQITTHTRVMDIIDESGDIIVKKLMEDIRFCAEYSCALDTDHTSIIKIVSNENDKHQPCWTYCLAEIIKNTHILCGQVTRCAWQIISARVDDLTNSSTENFDFLTHLWRNYITFACIIVGTENEGPIGAKELYNLLAAGLKNEHQREAVVMAFQRANLETLDSLFEVLKPYEQEYSSSKKTKKFRERLRNDISNILGHITENIPEGLLIENDKVRHGYMSHIQESMLYIASCEVIDESGLYLYNFFSLVYNVASDLEIVSKEEFYFDRALRKKLFLFFVYWTSQSFDEVTQREISNELFHKKNIHRRQNIPQNEGGMALLIQHKACLAAAALLCFPLHKEEPVTNEDSTLSWIRKMLKHDQPELKEAALKGLQGFLRSNAESPEVFKIAVSNCYSHEKDVRDGYFLAIVDLFRNESELTGFHYGTLINLILYKMADEEINIRRNSVQLLQIIGALREDVEEFWTDNYCPPSIDSSLFELHQHDQLEVSTRLAKDYKQCAIEVFSEMVYRLESVSPLDQKLMLSYIIPWIRRIKLEKLHPTILTVFLQKMFWITLKFDGNTHYSYVFNLWQTLAKRDDNIVLITDFSLSMGSAKKNPEFVNLAKRVAVYLCNTNPSVTLDAFVNELSTISKSRRRKKRVNFPTIIKYDIHSLNINLDPYATIKTIHRDINIDNLNSNSGNNENNNNNINNINNTNNNVNNQSQSNPASAHENEENFPHAEPTDIILSSSPSNNNILVSVSSNNINLMSNTNSVNNTSGGNIASLAVPVIAQQELSPRGGASTKLNPSQIPAPSQNQQPPLSPHNTPPPPRPLTNSYNLSLNDLMPEVSNFISPARGHLALVLIAEISFEKIATQVVNHLPVLLQQIFLGLDNINRLVYDHCRILLQNLIEMLVLDRERRKDNYLESEAYLEGQQLVEFLKSRERKPFWVRENIAESHSKNRSSEHLKTLVNQVAKVLSGKYTKLIESWGAEAHAWAINCPDDHWRCRSLQIFRTLNPTPTSEIVVDLIHLLLKEVKELEYAARSPCGIVLEILYTLQKMVDNMDSNRIVLFNQIFWSSVALLRTDFEVIYNQAVILLSIIIDHVDFNEKAVQSVLLASKPQNWKPDFLGIQPMLLKGLLSEQTYLNAIEVLSNIAPLPLDEIFHNDPSRMVTNMLGLLPWMCSNLGNSSEIAKCIKKAELIAIACKRTRLNELFEVFSKLHTYSNVSLFLDDWSEAFAKSFFPQFGVFTFTFLLELLQQGPSKYHRSILWLLHSLTKNFDINQKEINSKIPSWFGLVVQFINADLWREALQVLSASVQQCPLTSSQIDISNLPSYRANQKITYFKNVFGEGTISVVNSISKILSKSDVRSSENVISPRAFSKFFSSDDMHIRMSEDEEDPDAQNSSMISKTTSTPNKEEDESDYGGGSMVELESSEGEGSVYEKSDESEDEKFYSRDTNNPTQTPDLFPSHQPGFGGGFGGGFPSFKGFNDIFDDIQKENEFK